MSMEPTITSGANILVVDDIPVNLEVLTQILKEHEYQVRAMPDGFQALSSAREEPPDLVLLDINMPEMSGFDVCKKLKKNEQTRDIPVIFISASDEILDKVRAFFSGGVDYITSPFQAEEVLARVETHLSLRNLQKHLQQKNTRLEQEITKRKRMEESLRESEERYRQLVELSPDAIIVLQDEQCVYVNTAAAQLLDAPSPDELIGMSFWEMVHPKYRGSLKRRMRTPKQGKTPVLMETKFLRRDGKRIDVEVVHAPISYQGQPATQIMVRNVTARKQADILLRKLKRAVETTEVGITIADTEGRIMYVNPADAKMHGYTVKELIGQRSNIFTTPDMREDSPKMDEDAKKARQWKRERINVRKDGTVFSVMLISNPIYGDKKTLLGRVTICEDLTRREQTEKLLQETEKRYRNMFKNATIGMFQANPEGRFITVNPALAGILGYASARELIQSVTNIAEQLSVDPHRWNKVTEMVQDSQEAVKIETRLRNKEGGELIVLLNIWAVRNKRNELRYFEGFIQDITERKHTEKALRQQAILLRGAAGGMNHLLVGATLKTSLMDLLEILGAVTDVERISIFELHRHPETDESLMSQRFIWAKELNIVKTDLPELQNLSYPDALKHWNETLESNKPLWGTVQDLSQAEREILEAEGVISLLVIPIRVNNRLWGFMRFDNCQIERSWSYEERSILLALAGSIGGAIDRRQARNRLIAANDELAEALEDLKRAKNNPLKEGIMKK